VKDNEIAKDHLSTLLEISNHLNSSLNFDEVLRNAMDQVVSLLNAERGFIMLVENTKLELKAAKKFDPSDMDKDRSFSQGVVDETFLNGKPILTMNAMDDRRFSKRDSVVASGLRSVMCVPVNSKGRTIGVIYLDNRFKSGVFKKRDLDTLVTFANHAGIAIDNAKLYQNLKNSITEKLRLQEEIYNERMKGVVERETSKLREELTHHIVHDLRNPLTVVFTAFGVFTSLISRDLSDEENELLVKSHSNLKLLSNMLNEILDVYRLENKELKPDIKKLDLEILANNIFANIETKENVEYRTSISPAPFYIFADRSLINRVLRNLVSNACHYTKKGSIEIRGSRDKGNNQVVIEVADTGLGISEEHREKIFSKFVKINQKGNSRFSKGLGLAFCKLVVEAHNGSIEAVANPEGGAILRFTLP